MNDDPLYSEISNLMGEPEEAGRFSPTEKVWSETAVRMAMLKAYNAALDKVANKSSKNIEITGEVTVIVPTGTDEVFLRTNLPSPFSPSVDPNPVSLQFKTPHNKGEEYVKRVFGINPKIIKV